MDATIINAPSSTKNKDKQRDPDVHQKKLIHCVVAIAADVHDSVILGDLLHGDETRVWGDSAACFQGLSGSMAFRR